MVLQRLYCGSGPRRSPWCGMLHRAALQQHSWLLEYCKHCLNACVAAADVAIQREGGLSSRGLNSASSAVAGNLFFLPRNAYIIDVQPAAVPQGMAWAAALVADMAPSNWTLLEGFPAQRAPWQAIRDGMGANASLWASSQWGIKEKSGVLLQMGPAQRWEFVPFCTSL